MIFLSMDRGLRIVVEPGGFDYVTVGGATREVPRNGKSIEFTPLAKPMDSPLPAQGNRTRAEGVFDSRRAEQRKGLSQNEAEEYLLNYHGYGVTVIGFGDDGRAVGHGDTDAALNDQVIVPSGDKMYCKLCDQYLEKRGAHNHPSSKVHQARLADMTEKEKEQILGAG